MISDKQHEGGYSIRSEEKRLRPRSHPLNRDLFRISLLVFILIVNLDGADSYRSHANGMNKGLERPNNNILGRIRRDDFEIRHEWVNDPFLQRLPRVSGGATSGPLWDKGSRPIIVAESISEHLDRRHENRKVTCEDCHGLPSPAQKGSAERCIGCHSSYENAAALTKNSSKDPHNSHLGKISCTICHKVHTDSVLYCNNCHTFDLKVP
jgi:hypothetical protein